MLSLDEMIQHYEEVAEEQEEKAKEGRLQFETWDYISKCEECASEHRQLAKWLKELKEYKEGRVGCEFCKHNFRKENERPCSLCQHNFMDMFEEGNGNE